MGKMSLTSCRALSTPGKFSNVDRYGVSAGVSASIIGLLRYLNAHNIVCRLVIIYHSCYLDLVLESSRYSCPT